MDGWESLLAIYKLWLVVMADDENYLYIFLCTQELSRPASICSVCLAQTYKEEENIPSSLHRGMYKAMNTPGEQVHGGLLGVGQDLGGGGNGQLWWMIILTPEFCS